MSELNKDFISLLLSDLPNEANLQLPDPSLLTYFEELKNRTVWISDEINDSTLDIVSKIIHWNREDKDIPVKERKPIRLFICSPGGSLEVEETIVSIINLSKTPIYGIALGCVASAASLIYLSCHRRFALPNAYFILHRGSCSNISGSFDDVQAAMQDYKITIEKMESFYIEHTKYSEEEIKKGLEHDWYVRFPEAIDKGIVTDMVEDIEVML